MPPITKHKEQRIGVLIDVQNLYHSAKIKLFNERKIIIKK